MNRWTRRLLIGSLLLFILGVGFVIAGLVMGATSGDIKNMIERYIPINGIEWGEYSIGKDGKLILQEEDDEVRSFEFDTTDIRKLDLELISADCAIYPSSTDKIIVTTDADKNILTVKKSNGKLKLESSVVNLVNGGTKIDIYLPKNLELDDLEMSLSGCMHISCPIQSKMIHLKVEGAELISDSVVTTTDFELELGAGSADFSYVDADNMSIENGAGETVMGLAGQKEQYNVKMEVAAGEVTYGTRSYSGLAHEFSDSPKDATKKIDIECAAGKVTVSFEETVDV